MSIPVEQDITFLLKARKPNGCFSHLRAPVDEGHLRSSRKCSRSKFMRCVSTGKSEEFSNKTQINLMYRKKTPKQFTMYRGNVAREK